MDIDYIIVQAGGKGSRLGHLTANKPKAIVPVYNQPMIFHLFKKYPDKRFIIIGDYHKEVLRQYLEVFAKVKYLMADVNGATGTCAGLQTALQYVPENEPFLLIWSDLILSEGYELPEETGNYVGLSETFECRWKYENGNFEEERSKEFGVAGFFIFQNKDLLKDVPESGEFVRWLKSKNMYFNTVGIGGTKEFGILEEYEKLNVEKCRPFNKMTIDGDRIIKEGIDDQGKKLAIRERRWYQIIKEKGYPYIPAILRYDPLVMEKIEGHNIYEYHPDKEVKEQIIERLINAIKELHQLEKAPTDSFSMWEAYYRKTIERIDIIRDLVPYAKDQFIIINDKKCRNVFFYKKELGRLISKLTCKEFQLLHGDCTFSNLMLRNDMEPVLIDPRGYFGHTEMLGDPKYDWAKLYYSIVGNYDQFNLKNFRLTIDEGRVSIRIDSNGWEDVEERFFELLEDEVERKEIKILHAIIWLSLTTYAWQDYDSICGAFYNGLYYLEDVL